ncbi:hypothetical protein L9F63_023562, partial [Diploptera punctata]
PSFFSFLRSSKIPSTFHMRVRKSLPSYQSRLIVLQYSVKNSLFWYTSELD